MMLAIHKLPVPVIARVHGMATAAGCQLVAQCDLAVAAEEASFATSGIHYGLFCATPSVPLVRNVPAKRAMEMLLTGDFIDARTALAQGLVNRVVAADALDAEVEKLVHSILESPAPQWPWARPSCTSSANWGWKPPTSWQAKPWPAT